MKNFILEVCVDSVESALAAEAGGATRLELCQNLVIGGTTPSPALFEAVRKRTSIAVHVLIRPRFGDFCYSTYEFEMMKDEIRHYRSMGAEGVVIGILEPSGVLNFRQMEQLMEASEGMSVTLHRAFDMCRDPMEALRTAETLGIDTILTSGQKNSCMEGRALLRELETASAGGVCIQAGGGVSAEAIALLAPETGIRAWHMSGKVKLDSGMLFRKKDVSMGLPSMSEYEIYRTSEERVRAACLALERL